MTAGRKTLRATCAALVLGCSVAVGSVPFALLSMSVEGPPPRTSQLRSPGSSEENEKRSSARDALTLSGGARNASSSSGGSSSSDSSGRNITRSNSGGSGGGSGDNRTEEEILKGFELLPKRIADAFESYRQRLREDVKLAIHDRFEGLMSRYKATEASEVGWLEAQPGRQSVVDDTGTFLVLLQEIRRRQEYNSFLSRLERKIEGVAHALDGGGEQEPGSEKSDELGGAGGSGATGDAGAAGGTSGDDEVRQRMQSVMDLSEKELQKYAYLLVPGLLSQYSPQIYFLETINRFQKELGLDTSYVSLDSEASVASNAAVLQEAVLKAREETGKPVMIIGHSKGGLDAAAAVALYPKLEGIVAGIIFVQSPYGGSPIAADMLVDEAIRKPVEFMLETVLRTRRDALHDLSYESRQSFVTAHPLPPFHRLPRISFHSVTSSMTSPMFMTGRYIRKRYDEPSDGMVACRDAEVPGSVVVRFKSYDMDHLGPIYPSVPLSAGPLRLGFAAPGSGPPSGADVCEALVRMLIHHARTPRRLRGIPAPEPPPTAALDAEDATAGAADAQEGATPSASSPSRGGGSRRSAGPLSSAELSRQHQELQWQEPPPALLLWP